MKNKEILQLTEKYVMHTYARYPVAFVRGKGCYLWDADGKKYLDCLSGIAVVALGHSHPAIAQAVAKQADQLIHTSNLFHIKPQAELARLLCGHSFADKVFFCNSGAEANEAAVKLIRRYGKQTKGEGCYHIITAENSFHGRTLKTMAATGQEKIKAGFEPLPEGFSHVPYDDVTALANAVTDQTAAILLEPVQGEGGVRFPAQDYLQAVRKLCDEKDILLVFDEIQTGLGRTGKLFAYEHSGIEPDILTLAKSLGGGLPIGACLAKEKVAEVFRPGDHATTFGGNFLVCEAAKSFLAVLTEPGFLSNVQDMGQYFCERLTGLKSKFSFIQEVRGEGLMIGMELNIPGKNIVDQALDEGLIINCTQEKILRFLPPLIISKKQVDEAVEILEDVLEQA